MSSRATPCPAGRLDTVGLAFDVSPDVDVTGATVTVLDYGEPTQRVLSRRRLGGGGFLSVSGGRAWVEASLPKRVGDGNVEALAVGAAKDAAFELYCEALGFVVPVGEGKEFDRCKVVRLDPVRDFDDVSHVGELLDGLAAVPRDLRYKSRRFADPERNRAESLRVGPKSWGAQLYDKCVETGGVAAEGRLRFETRLHSEQLRSDWAARRGCVVREIGDLSEGKVRAMTHASFERVGFDREVVGRASVWQKVGASGLSRRQQAELWTFLTAPGAAESMHRSARYRYRDLAASLGVTMAAASDEAKDVLVRLDFESGREVCRVA